MCTYLFFLILKSNLLTSFSVVYNAQKIRDPEFITFVYNKCCRYIMVKIVIFKLQICNNNITLVSMFLNTVSGSFVFLILHGHMFFHNETWVVYKLIRNFWAHNSIITYMYLNKYFSQLIYSHNILRVWLHFWVGSWQNLLCFRYHSLVLARRRKYYISFYCIF